MKTAEYRPFLAALNAQIKIQNEIYQWYTKKASRGSVEENSGFEKHLQAWLSPFSYIDRWLKTLTPAAMRTAFGDAALLFALCDDIAAAKYRFLACPSRRSDKSDVSSREYRVLYRAMFQKVVPALSQESRAFVRLSRLYATSRARFLRLYALRPALAQQVALDALNDISVNDIASAFDDNGLHRTAAVCWEHMFTSDKDSAVYLVEAANCRAKAGDTQKAIEYFRRVISLGPVEEFFYDYAQGRLSDLSGDHAKER